MEKSKLKDIILVTSDEKALSYKWEDNAKSIKGIQVVSEEHDLEVLEKHLVFIGQIRDKEQVFIKDPFVENCYVEISKAEDRFFRNKIKSYKKIALLLGAKTFNAKAEFIEENKLSIEADGSIGHTTFDVKAEFAKEQSSKLNKKYKLNSTLMPIENFDRLRGFEEAKEEVRRLGLQDEIDIVGLIENNDPSLQNREISQIVSLELTNELNDLLEMAFSLNVMGGVFGLGARFKSTTESFNTIVLETEIVF